MNPKNLPVASRPKSSITNRSDGFSLIEVLVVMGLFGVVAVGSLEMLDIQFRMQKKQDATTGIYDFSEEIAQIVTAAGTCTANLKDKDVGSSLALANLSGADGLVKFTVGSEYANRGARLTALRVSDYTRYTAATALVNFNVEFMRIADGQTVRRRIPLIVHVKNATDSTLVNCGGLGSPEEACRDFGGKLIVGSTPSESRCVFSAYLTGPDPAMRLADSPFQISAFGKIGELGQMGMGLPYGDFWGDGHNDSYTQFDYTRADSSGGFSFLWANDPANAPFPKWPPDSSVKTLLLAQGSGAVGIGYNAPLSPTDPIPSTAGTKLFVKGDVRVTGDVHSEDLNATSEIWASGVMLASDSRLKKDLRPILSALDRLSRVRGVHFAWRPGASANSGEDIGLIAQEVEKIFPELVVRDEKGNRAIQYEKFVPILIEALHELRIETDEFERDLRAAEMKVRKYPGSSR